MMTMVIAYIAFTLCLNVFMAVIWNGISILNLIIKLTFIFSSIAAILLLVKCIIAH